MIIQNFEAYEAATKGRILANARKTFLTTYPDGLSIIAWCNVNGRDGGDYRDSFAGSLAKSLDFYGKLSAGQVEAVRKCIAAAAARMQEWADKKAAENATKQWVGEVGAKIELTLKVRRAIILDGYYGKTWLYICSDQDGNDVIYKGTGAFIDEGETGTVIATVKEQGVRDGVKQTVIQRPKLKGETV